MASHAITIILALSLLAIPPIAARPPPMQLIARDVPIVTLLPITALPITFEVPPGETPTYTFAYDSASATATVAETQTLTPTPIFTPFCDTPDLEGTWLDEDFGQSLGNLLKQAATAYNKIIYPIVGACLALNQEIFDDLQAFYNYYYIAEVGIHGPASIDNLHKQGLLTDQVCDALEAVEVVIAEIGELGGPETCSVYGGLGTATATYPCLEPGYPDAPRPYLIPELDSIDSPNITNVRQGLGCRGEVISNGSRKRELRAARKG